MSWLKRLFGGAPKTTNGAKPAESFAKQAAVTFDGFASQLEEIAQPAETAIARELLGVAQNLRYASDALRTGQDPDGRSIRPSQVGDGLLNLHRAAAPMLSAWRSVFGDRAWVIGNILNSMQGIAEHLRDSTLKQQPVPRPSGVAPAPATMKGKKDLSVAPSRSQAEPAKELTIDLGSGLTMKLALIAAGKFMMGSPDSEHSRDGYAGPLHEVTLSKPFYMGVTVVTQTQYQAVMGTNPSQFKGVINPVDSVSWNDATEFCRKLSKKTSKTFRLPTEAEWEHACRAGSKTWFCFGDAEEGLGDYAWYHANSGNATHPVGQKKPNAWGIYDMHGNVWELCADWYGDYPKGAVTDPQGPASGSQRVVRGGCWGYCSSGNCGAAFRFRIIPDGRLCSVGFRVLVPVGGVDLK